MPIQNRNNKNRPNAEQKRWMELLRECRSVISGDPNDIEIHHALGQSAKIKTAHGTENIGHWFLIVLTKTEHLWMHGHSDDIVDRNISHVFDSFSYVFDSSGLSKLEIEKVLFFKQISNLISIGRAMDITVPGQVLAGIATYHR